MLGGGEVRVAVPPERFPAREPAPFCCQRLLTEPAGCDVVPPDPPLGPGWARVP